MIWIKLALIGIFVAGLFYAVHATLEHFREQGRIEVRKELQPKLDEANAAERQREQETAACVSASKVQSDAIAAAAKRAADAQAESAALIAKARESAKRQATEIATLKAYAAAQPKVSLTCTEELAATKRILDRGDEE